MGDGLSDRYIELLAAVLERANQDAHGRVTGVYVSDTQARIQQEAASFLESVAPSLVDLALPDIPLGKQRRGL